MESQKRIHIAWHSRNGVVSEGWNHPAWGRNHEWNRADVYREVGQILERARLDMIVFSDSLDTTAPEDATAAVGRLDTLVLAATIVDVTKSIGIAPAVMTEMYRPFMIARLISSMDHFSSGRAGWMVQPLLSDAGVRAIGQYMPIPEAEADRIRRGAEFIEICRKLWNSWEVDALVGDTATATFADPEKVHEIDHKGEFYNSRGPLNTVRPPQGQPVTLMAPTREGEWDLAAAQADVVIVSGKTVEALRSATAALREKLVAAGRADKVTVLVSVNPVVAASSEGAEAAAARIDAAYRPSSFGGLRITGNPDQACDAIEALIAATGADGIAIDAIWMPSYAIQLMSYLVTPLQRRGVFPSTYGAETLHGLLETA